MPAFFQKKAEESDEEKDLLSALGGVEEFFAEYFTDPICLSTNPNWSVSLENSGMTSDGVRWKHLGFKLNSNNFAISDFRGEADEISCSVAIEGWKFARAGDMAFLLKACSCFFGSHCLEKFEQNYSRFQMSWTELLWDREVRATEEKTLPRFSLRSSQTDYRRLPKHEWVFHF
jgi:hypothetical protein